MKGGLRGPIEKGAILDNNWTKGRKTRLLGVDITKLKHDIHLITCTCGRSFWKNEWEEHLKEDG